MSYPKSTTAGDIFLLMNLIALFAMAYEFEYQEQKQTTYEIQAEYWWNGNAK